MTAPTVASVSYSAASGVDAAELLSLWVPSGTPPAGGWPVLLWILTTTPTAVPTIPSALPEDQDVPFQAFANPDQPFAVALVTVCSSTSGEDGGGLFQAPGSARWIDGDFPNPWKSACQAVGWARTNAGTHSLDPDRVVLGGHQFGGTLAAWAGLSEDWSQATGGAQFHSAVSTRPDGFVAVAPVGDFRAVLSTTAFRAFADAGDDDAVATRLSNAAPADLAAASPLAVGFDTTTYPSAAGLNANQPALLASPTPWDGADFGSTLGDMAASGLALGAPAHAVAIRAAMLGEDDDAQMLATTLVLEPGTAPLPIAADALDDSDWSDRFGPAVGQWLAGVATAQPPIEPVEERIAESLLAALRGISAGANYFTTPRRVSKEPVVWADSGRLPELSVLLESWSSEGISRDATGRVDRTLRFVIDGGVPEGRDPTRAARRLAHDIERAVYLDRQRGDTSTDTIVTGADFVYSDPEQGHIAGVRVFVTIYARVDQAEILLPT